ncbi:MAG: DEAD/DEAH box helicase [Methanomicrobiales archaeon]|nr:DEAD/DEAH box helicase [Methanomicrobiales archaeon]
MRAETAAEKISFADLPLSREVQRGIGDMGFEEPTPIQSLAILPILERRDVVGQAYTGTGKTAAFGIPALEMADPRDRRVQTIVLCPTRELAIQVSDELRKIGRYRKGIQVLPVYGGAPIERQISALRRGVQIVIGTPGRVMDHMRRGTLSLDAVRLVVLDEADEMLDMGFYDDIETILRGIPRQRQMVLFSATMPQGILDLARQFQHEPLFVKVTHRQLTVPGIEQYYFEVQERHKADLLSRLVDLQAFRSVLVFCNTKRKVDDLVNTLQARGYSVEGLHGDMGQSQRERVMGKFRSGETEILVATDVAARGIDVGGIEAVVNYDVPQDEEYYVHRIGRTGRMGRGGRAYTFVSGREVQKLREIQRFTGTTIAQQPIPSPVEVEEARASILLDRVQEVLEAEKLEPYILLVERLQRLDYTSLEVAAALLKMLMIQESTGGRER